MSVLPFSNLEVHAFRGLRGVRLQGLSRVNVIVGRNNAGKTSLLEAVAACCQPLNGAWWVDIPGWRGATRQPVEDQVAWLFPQADSRGQDIWLGWQRGTFQFELTGHLERTREVADDPVEVGGTTQAVSMVELRLGRGPGGCAAEPGETRGATDGPQQVLAFTVGPRRPFPRLTTGQEVPAILINIGLHRVEQFVVKLLSADTWKTEEDEALVQLLQTFDPAVRKVRVDSPTAAGPSIRVLHDRLDWAAINTFGEGFRRVLTYAACMVSSRGGVLLVDEIETAIHYSAQLEVYRWLVEASARLDVQLFVTTHSLEAIDALLDATPNLPDTTFFRLQRGQQGIQVVRADEEETRTVRESWGGEVRG